MKQKASIFTHMTFIFALVIILLTVAVIAAIPSGGKNGATAPDSYRNRLGSFLGSITLHYEGGVILLDYDLGRVKPAPSHTRINLNPRDFLGKRSFWGNFIALIFLLMTLVWLVVESINLSMLMLGLIGANITKRFKRVARGFPKSLIGSRRIGYQPKHAQQESVF